jgi:hypothetical protein
LENEKMQIKREIQQLAKGTPKTKRRIGVHKTIHS